MNNVIEVTAQEAQDNFDFLFELCCRGTSIKILTDSGSRVMMVPLPTFQAAGQQIEMQQPPLPVDLPRDPEEFVDPIATRNYVNEELSKMQTELKS